MTAAGEPANFQSRLCYSLVADILKQVEIELIEIKAVRFLCDYPWAPGKRLRPITFLLSNLGVRLDRALPLHMNGRESRLASAIELLHEASLIHDDLVDRSEVRRGAPTMQMSNGEGLALLVGDYMVFRGLKLVLDAAESREDIVLAQELASTGLNIAHGEAEQLDRYLNRRGGPDRMAMSTYIDVIAKKTAAFFAGCAEGGAALAGADPALRRVYREFGMSMGLLFQMLDDMMDIAGDPAKARKTLRNNLAEGTVTLPMIHAWSLYPDDPALAALAAGAPIPARQQTRLYRRLGEAAVRQRCEETMAHYAAAAAGWLDRMPVNIYRLGLYDLLDYVRSCPWGGIAPRPVRKRKASTMIDHHDLDAVRSWFAAHKAEIIRDFAAEGAGVGRSRSGDGYAITVYLDSADKRPAGAVARDGVPLEFEVTGKFRAQHPPAG